MVELPDGHVASGGADRIQNHLFVLMLGCILVMMVDIIVVLPD